MQCQKISKMRTRVGKVIHPSSSYIPSTHAQKETMGLERRACHGLHVGLNMNLNTWFTNLAIECFRPRCLVITGRQVKFMDVDEAILRFPTHGLLILPRGWVLKTGHSKLDRQSFIDMIVLSER